MYSTNIVCYVYLKRLRLRLPFTVNIHIILQTILITQFIFPSNILYTSPIILHKRCYQLYCGSNKSILEQLFIIGGAHTHKTI
jgi:hypothetical protein